MTRWSTTITAAAGALLLAAGPASAERCPKEGGSLRIGLPGDVSVLDPFVTGALDRTVYMNIFETLVSLDPDGTISPALATEWELIDDTTWRMKLREGVTFHSGTPFNAETVVWHYESHMNPDSPGKALATFEGTVAAIEVVDDYTVDIHLEEPYAPFLSFMASSHEAFAIRDPVKAQELGDRYGAEPSGTGPFRFKSWARGSEIVLDSHKERWRGGPCVDEMVLKIMPEASTRFAALLAGEIDLTTGLPPEQIAILEARDDFTIESIASDRVISFLFNRDREIWDDVNVRRAISLAIDTKGVTEGLLGVLGTPTGSFIGPAHDGYADVGFIEYDIERARQLLADAGYGPGNPLSFSLGVGPERDPRNRDLAEIIQASLQAIGVQVEIQAITFSVFYRSLWEEDGMEYDSIILGWGTQSTDPHHSFYNQLHERRIPPTAQNFSRLRHAGLNDLLDRQTVETDPDKRVELFRDIQHLLYDEVLVVPLYALNRTWAMRADVKGFHPHPVEWWAYQHADVWFDR
jgi:peptide/nickel transport system substrate-binding protein